MKIYLDYIFLENLIVNTVIIIETIKFTKSKISNKRKIFVILIDTVLSCFFTLNNYSSIFHFIFSLITFFILFKPKTLFEYIKKVLCFYMLYIMYLGLIISTCIILKINLEIFIYKILIYIFTGFLFHFICKDLWKMWKMHITENNLFYTLWINGIEINAFVDTGNSVKEPITSLDVIFVNSKYKEKILNGNEKLNKLKLEINTISGNDEKEAYIVKDIIVYKRKNKIAKLDKIVLSFISINSSTPEKYSAIIGYNTYLEKLEGVIL